MFEAARANQNGVDVNNIASIAFDLDFHDKIGDEPFRFGQSTSHPSDPTTMWVRYSIPSNNCVRLVEGSCLGSPAVTHEQCTRIADAAVLELEGEETRLRQRGCRKRTRDAIRRGGDGVTARGGKEQQPDGGDQESAHKVCSLWHTIAGAEIEIK